MIKLPQLVIVDSLGNIHLVLSMSKKTNKQNAIYQGRWWKWSSYRWTLTILSFLFTLLSMSLFNVQFFLFFWDTSLYFNCCLKRSLPRTREKKLFFTLLNPYLFYFLPYHYKYKNISPPKKTTLQPETLEQISDMITK